MIRIRKKIFSALLTGIVVFSSFGLVKAEENNSLSIYVDMHCEVSGDGSADSPFKTVYEAQEAVRDIIAKGEYPKGGITVFLREGQYVLDKTLTFDERDSGTPESPVVWRAYYGEDVIITTGSSIPFSEFSLSDDPRIRDEVKGKVYSINLTENGYPVHDGIFMTGSAQHYFWNWGMCEPGEPWRGSPNPKLMMGETEGIIARYPNTGYLKMGKVLTNGNVDDGLWYESGTVGHKIDGEIRGFIMEFNDDRIESWKSAKDAWLYGIFRWDWDDYQVKVETIDTENRTIETTHPYRDKVAEGRESWYILNLLEEIDIPGEWYCDTEKGELFIYPPQELRKDEKISLSFQKSDILSFNGAKNITFKEVTLTSTRAQCLKVENCDNLDFQYLEICYTAGDAMQIDGTNISVSGCYIHNIGKVGSISGHGGDNYNDLIPNGNIIENCWIHNAGVFSLGGVGTVYRNNLVHDSGGSILTIAGNDALIERNEIHNVMKSTSDAGAFYSVDHVTLCGNVIRDNVFHDMTLNMKDAVEPVHAIYLDNYTSGWTITNNVVYNVDGFGVFINMGHANTVTDNIFVNTRRGVYANMGRFDNSNVETIPAKALEEEHLTNKAWEKYPHIKEMTDPNWWHGRMNYVADNLCYNVQGEPMKVSYLNVLAAKINENNTFKEGLTTSNPNEFVAAEKNNYTLRENSKIGEKLPNLKNIDMSKASTVTSQIKRVIGDNAICFLKGSPEAYVNFTKYLINDKNTNVSAFTEDEATYIPLRFIKEQKNGQIEWNNGEILIDYNGNEVKLYPNSKEFYENSAKKELKYPIKLIDGTSYIGAEDYAEIFGVALTEFDNGLVILAKNDVKEKFDEYMLKDLYQRLK